MLVIRVLLGDGLDVGINDGIGGFQPSSVLVGAGRGTFLADQSDEAILLVNNDPNNTIYIGGDQGVSPSQSIIATIPPLGSVALTTSDGPIFGVCAVGQTALCQIIPGGLAYAPSPVLIAQQVLNSGVIIVDNPKALINGNVSITPSNNVTRGPFTVNTFQSWVISMTFSGAVPANPYMPLRFYWSTDVAGQNITYIEDFVVTSDGSVGTGFATYVGHGPMYGPYMFVQFSNDDNATTINPLISLFGSGRPTNETTLRSWNVQAPPGLGTDDALLFFASNSLAANTSSAVQVGNYYNGPVTVRFNVTAASIVANTVQLFVRFRPIADFGGNAGYIFTGPAVAAGLQSPDQVFNVNFPRRPYDVQVQNTSGTIAVSYRVNIYAKGAVQ